MHTKTPILILATGIIAASLLLIAGSRFAKSDRSLLREAARDFEKANRGEAPTVYWDIFCQQAAQGYYDDAMATLLLSPSDRDLQYALVILASIRAKNGDTPGALRTANAYPNPETRVKAINEIAISRAKIGDVGGAREVAASLTDPRAALEGIAIAQAWKGDLLGARKTVAAIGSSNSVLEAIAGFQIQSGAFDAALGTIQELYPASSDNLLLDLADALKARGQQANIHQLALRVKNPAVAALFLKYVRLRESMLENAVVDASVCDQADFLGKQQHQFSVAYALINGTMCWYSTIAAEQYAIDPAQAEQALGYSTDAKDVCFGESNFAIEAAKKGDTRDAVRFIDDAQELCGGQDGWLPDAVRQVAREWATRERPEIVVEWARSRPSSSQRGLALLGVAEAMGHAHPE
jgi:hypothetical protein